MDMNKQAVNLFVAIGVVFAATVALPTETLARHNQTGDNLLMAQAPQGAVKSPSGLQYTDEKVGSGQSPRTGQTVSVNYTGWLTNGKQFDSSVRRGPFQFRLGQGEVIRGWDEGVASMKVGGKRKLVIPPDLAYGQKGVGNGLIPPNSTLVFEVELLGVQ